jgi:hypothetical protein
MIAAQHYGECEGHRPRVKVNVLGDGLSLAGFWVITETLIILGAQILSRSATDAPGTIYVEIS